MFSVRDTHSEISFVTRARAMYHDVISGDVQGIIYPYSLFIDNENNGKYPTMGGWQIYIKRLEMVMGYHLSPGNG